MGNLYLPNVTAKFLTHSRQLKVYDEGFLIVDDIIDTPECEDIDFWVEGEVNGEIWDFNLNEEVGETACTICAYPVVDGETDTSRWQRIKLELLPE